MNTKFIWLDGEFLPWKQANMHVLSHHYGVGVFEGVRAYKTSQGTAIFRLQAHTDRLFRSAHILNMSIPYDRNVLNQVQCEILHKNQLENAYLRPLVFYGGEYLGISVGSLSTHVMVAAVDLKEVYGEEKTREGLKVHTSSFVRTHVNSVFCKAKANGNYMNSILAMQEAHHYGADDALLLDQQGYVVEASAAHVFMVRDGTLYTPDIPSLEGITRDTITTLAKDLGLTVIKKHITRDEIYIADEFFLTGTAVEVIPVCELDGRLIGQGKKGPITQCLTERYRAVVRGENLNYQHWLSPISLVKEGNACLSV